MAETHKLSEAAYDRLSAELADLTTRGRIDIARKIETARELGDLSENGDYQAAKEEQGKMEGRIRHLTKILADAVIIDASEKADSEEVTLGSYVEITWDDEDEPERYFVGSIEEQPDDVFVVSPGSPMGEALLGASIGDRVEFESPGGMLRVTVVSVGN
ncbi:MAG: transcription elongation factor GreA [Acidimicrobiaceae bacterium]|nr:transcription elongation factor GreA [Acidimicrobiaceae bacterium]